MRSLSAMRLVCGSAALALVGGLAVLGCIEGKAPYEVIPQSGGARDFLPPPPTGITPGTTHELGQLYRFDRTKYRLFLRLPGTDPKYIRRDSVLAAANATQADRYQPDHSDPTLQSVYANPRLFGFVPSVAAQAGFVDGATVGEAWRYRPTNVGDWWETNHNQREWMILDSVVTNNYAPPTADGGMPVYHLRTTCDVAPQREQMFLPPIYAADTYGTAAPGTGLYLHAWTLISERDIPPALRGGPRGLPDRQRNPRGLWLSIQSLDQSRDPQASPPVTTDQCLDGLPGHLELFPLKLCGDQIQEGDIYSTWTYLTVDTNVLHERLASEAGLPRGGRCGTPIGIGTDTLTMFPTKSFRLLCNYQVRCERIIDQVAITIGTETVGLYPRTPSPGAIVELTVTMSLGTYSGQLTPAQYLELWYLRDIGQVITRMGVNRDTRSEARLRSCRVNNVDYPPDNPVFHYQD